MLKRLAFFALCAALLYLGVMLVQGHWFFLPDALDEKNSTIPLNNATDTLSDNDALALTLKEIKLSQGEGGFELWRLKAQWASVQKEGDRVLVEQPRLTYFMKEDGKTLQVRSERGDIAQKSQLLRFITNVQIAQDNKRIVGELLVYNGTRKTMTFPRGGNFTDTGMSGSARFVEWHIDTRIIDADGDVAVFFQGHSRSNGKALP